MKKSSKILYILLALIIIFAVYWLSTKKPQENKVVNNTNDQTQNVGLANPASEFCVRNGGISEIVTNADGSQGGICNFGEGKTCDETALFRNTCNLEGVLSSVVYKNASGTEVFASYNLKTDKAYISSLDLYMNNLELNHAVSGSGARYLSADGEVELWEHQGEGTVSIRGEEAFVGKIVVAE
ncbi:hypothetical protein SDC9_07794 [bioreactor metagenome]|uniref:C-type lysozyme inhibitor domain-containing protein n=1 Tax=bioreactor metagenome TaxID=1076179 RepID=A0A644T5Y2_9ZZZZ|nr:DUF333 domain-containing protein [Candidatus Elulimicrobiales bacterium]